MRFTLLISFFLLATTLAHAQYEAPSGPLPSKFATLERAIQVNHFPAVVDAVEDPKEKGIFHWKHNTAILSTESDIQIEEFGAYLFYNGAWNERISYPPKELDKMFGTKKGVLRQGQPYTFVNNWRSGDKVFGGWSLWYFIGTDPFGNRVCGYAPLETTDKLLPSTSPEQKFPHGTLREDGGWHRMGMDSSRSSMTWTGTSADGGYVLSGSIQPFRGELKVTEEAVHRGKISVDMKSILHEYADLVKHLKNEDFFDVDKHPMAHFELGESIQVGAPKAAVKGRLNVRGMDLPVKAQVAVKEKMEGLACHFEIVIDRTTFGSTYNSPSVHEDPGEHGIADAFTVTGVLFFPWPGPQEDN